MPRRPRPKQSKTKTEPRNNRLVLIGVIALVAVAAAVILIITTSNRPRFAGVPNPDRNTMGDPNAPILIEEFSDFQCPYCALFFRETEPEIVEKYIKTGQARLTYIPYSFIGPESIAAAEAAYCAADQNKFWDYHFQLFSNQGGENSGAFSDNNLMRFAAEAGLNMPQFRECYNANKYAKEIEDNFNQGRERKVTFTPSFFVNGKGPLNGVEVIPEIEKALQGQ